MLFSGVAFSITAFPVLCRILTELKLLDTTVGIVVLSAGVGNDISQFGYKHTETRASFVFAVGWTLLALSVALVNAASGLTALWVLLACVGWTIFLLFPVKWALRWLARHTGSSTFLWPPLIIPCYLSRIYSVESGPTVVFMTVTILILFGSAFFTDVIGVHAIFGMASYLCPLSLYGVISSLSVQGRSWQGSSCLVRVDWRSL
jgi:Kef-type K+ transport system membrane component KefB